MRFSNSVRKITIFLIVLAFALPNTLSFAYWYGSESLRKYIGFSVQIAEEIKGNVCPLDRLPKNTPPDILARITELWEASTTEREQQQVHLLVDALIYVVEDLIITSLSGVANDAEYKGVMIGRDRDDLFAYSDYSDNWGLNSRGHYILYTEVIDGVEKYQLIYVNPNSGFHLQPNSNSLDEALSYHWTRINLIANEYCITNTYTVWTAPVFTEEGRKYLLWNNGYNGTHPSINGAWFEITPGYAFISDNINAYYEGYIVSHGGLWFIASTTAWQAPTANPLPWEPWIRLEEWRAGTYNAGEVVWLNNRFYRANVATSIMPNSLSTRSGEWQEINNGWVGVGIGLTIKPHYVYDNNYQTGDMVIYGETARHNYRYFRAKKHVPPDQAPILRDSDRVTYINSEYWEPINS